MRANRKNPLIIQVTSNGTVTGTLTVKQFREYMNNTTSFISELIIRFNERKAQIGEPERVEQILNVR